MTEGPHGDDMIGLLLHDHREVEDLFQQIEAADDGKTRRELADQVTAELVRHSVAEELHLYPTARAALPDGDAMADREVGEHAEAEELLKRWEKLDGDDQEFVTVFRQVSSAVLAHIREEEDELFPRLREYVSEDDLDELGDKINQAKKMSPTRPHPSSPNTPPLNKILGPGAGLVDRLRDKLSGRKTD
ncbi:MAG: hemerythrin domain-containing protein [Nocardioidaceae bacterium]